MPDWKAQIRERLASLKSDNLRTDGAWQAEVTEELEQHLEDRYRELRRSGTPEEDARRLTLEELRDGGSLAEELRKTGRPPARSKPDWGKPESGGAWHAILPDIRLSFRSIAQRPGFSFLVIGMLMLGIGGNAAIFSIYNGLFLRALPFTESERLVDLDEAAPNWNLQFVGISNPDFFQWRSGNQSFESMAVFSGSAFNLVANGQSQRVQTAKVTYDLLDVLKLKPVIGRNFTSEEDRPGGAKVALIGHALWQRMFQGDRGALGKILQLNGEPYIIVGVLPPAATFPDQAELWTPLGFDSNGSNGWYLGGIGRLKPGVTIEQAYADLLRVHKGMIATGSKVNDITFPKVMPLRDRYLGDFRPVGRVLLGGVGVVLLIAVSYTVINLLVDIAYAFLDPRVRYT
jgi:hypothetical protein